MHHDGRGRQRFSIIFSSGEIVVEINHPTTVASSSVNMIVLLFYDLSYVLYVAYWIRIRDLVIKKI